MMGWKDIWEPRLFLKIKLQNLEIQLTRGHPAFLHGCSMHSRSLIEFISSTIQATICYAYSGK